MEYVFKTECHEEAKDLLLVHSYKSFIREFYFDFIRTPLKYQELDDETVKFLTDIKQKYINLAMELEIDIG